MGGLQEGARFDRRMFLVGAGATAGLLAMGCSSDPVRRSAAAPTPTPTTEPFDPSVSKYLQGPYAPVREETTLTDLEVTGSLPRELEGLYLRNGPNPWPVPAGQYDWFTGDGMVHGVELGGGGARWYRNRWIRTEIGENRMGARSQEARSTRSPPRTPATPR